MSTFCELVCSDLWLCIQHFLWAYALSSGCVFSTPWGLHAPLFCQIGHRVVCRGTGHVLSLRPSPILHLSILFIPRFPDRRLWDHAIILKEGFQPKSFHIYPISPAKE